jgi:SAM-dependent methyltransferase
MIDDGQDDTTRFYATNAARYAQGWDGAANPFLRPFLARLQPGSRILELGCGAGRDAQAMIAAGHDVDPTDGIPEIALQAELTLGRPVRVMRFEDLKDCTRYDAVWANASLLHVPRGALPGVLSRIRSALKPGGLHFATYKSGSGEGHDRHGRYFNYPTATELKEFYGLAGQWDWLSLEKFVESGFDRDRPEPWVAVTLRKPAP